MPRQDGQERRHAARVSCDRNVVVVEKCIHTDGCGVVMLESGPTVDLFLTSRNIEVQCSEGEWGRER